MIKSFSELPSFLQAQKPTGCFIDTSILVAATYDLDLFHEDTASAIELIAKAQVPTFTNITVRAEYLEHQRRIIISEGLCDFLEDFQSDLDGRLLLKLQSHRASYRKKIESKQTAKMDVHQIKSFCDLLSSIHTEKGNAWDIFCKNYFYKRITSIWSLVVQHFDLNFISIRSDDEHEFLNSIPTWENATAIMGRHGIGSSDAMILNLFLCSKIPVLITADMQMAKVASIENPNKIIFVPTRN